MTDQRPAGLTIIQQQLNELDRLAGQTLQDLNTVAGTERVAQWKARTVALLTQAVGQAEGQRFAGVHPGPSFTNDMFEEFAELVECYRTSLSALAKRLDDGLLIPPPEAGA